MRIIKAGHEHISKKGLTPYQFIERIGRVCYKSEDRITEDSAKDFVKGLINRGHTAMIEHFWVHMTFKGNYNTFQSQVSDFVWQVLNDLGDVSTFYRFMQVTQLPEITFISFPIRAMTDLVDRLAVKRHIDVPALVREMIYEVQFAYPLFFSDTTYKVEEVHTNMFNTWNESNFLDILLEYVSDKEIMKHITHTVLFRCNRGVSHELVRHRPCSFAQESTRYCNYSGDKFGNEITIIDPTTAGFYKDEKSFRIWCHACGTAESNYFGLLNRGATPQEARGVLPNDLKTEVVMTANETEWQHIVNLRAKQTTGKAHPQMVEIMTPWYEELKVLSEGRIV